MEPRWARVALVRAAIGVALAVGALPVPADMQAHQRGVQAMRGGDLPEAERQLEAALAAQEASAGEADRLMPLTLLALGQVYTARGRHADAATMLARALRLNTAALGEQHAATLDSMFALAVALRDLRQHTQQAALLEKLVKLRLETVGETNPLTLGAMGHLVKAYAELGRDRERYATNEHILRVQRRTLGERHPDTLVTMNNLAVAASQLGRMAESVTLLETVVTVRTELLGERHPDTFGALSNLAATYGRLGRHAEALPMQRRSLALANQVLGERNPQSLNTLYNLTITLLKLEQYPEAANLAQAHYKLRREVHGDRHPQTLNGLDALVILYRRLGLVDASVKAAESLVAAGMQVHGERHPRTLDWMSSLGNAYANAGAHDKSVALQRKVLALRLELLGPRHIDVVYSQAHVARALAGQQKVDEARALSAAFVAGAEEQRSQWGLSAQDRRGVFVDLAGQYRWFAALHGRAGETARAFELVELSKARTLLENLASRHAGRSGALPPADQERLDDLDRRAQVLEQRLAEAAAADGRQRLFAERSALNREHAELGVRLRQQHPKYAQLSDVRLLRAGDLRTLVPADAVAVNYVVDGPNVQALVVDAGGEPVWIDLGSMPGLEQAVEIVRLGNATRGGLAALASSEQRVAWRFPDGSYRLWHVNSEAPKGAERVTDAAEVAAVLSRRLLQPLRRHLESRRHWIVSPDGPLARLPFELLTLADQRVVDRADVHYVQSLSVYALTKDQQATYRTLNRPRELLALGDPVYAPSTNVGSMTRRAARATAVTRVAQLRELAALWDPLPGTRLEVQTLMRLFPERSDSLLGAEASEQRLMEMQRQGRLKEYRYVHLAAHGYLSPDEPALSSIVLSQQGLPPQIDGYITATEWPGFDLRSDLTVLSACETGLGGKLDGEGVMGLPYALFVAGSTNTLLSLWPADDDATAVFMGSFYRRLRDGVPLARALAETKREFVRHPRFSHPSNWANFVLIGAG